MKNKICLLRLQPSCTTACFNIILSAPRRPDPTVSDIGSSKCSIRACILVAVAEGKKSRAGELLLHTMRGRPTLNIYDVFREPEIVPVHVAMFIFSIPV